MEWIHDAEEFREDDFHDSGIHCGTTDDGKFGSATGVVIESDSGVCCGQICESTRGMVADTMFAERNRVYYSGSHDWG
jgi:hypothetical protein